MVNFDGKLIDTTGSFLSTNNRIFSHADGVKEVVRYSGGKLFFWEDHYFKLMSAMRIMRMKIPMSFTMEFLEEEIQKIIPKAEKNNTYLITLTTFRKNIANEVGYVIENKVVENPFYSSQEQFFEVDLFKDFYANAGLFSTINVLDRTLETVASVYAQENGLHACLLVNNLKHVIDATLGTLFLVKDNSIKTPPLSDGCKNSILRTKLIEVINKSEDFSIEEASISPFELQKADEMFILNQEIGIQSVSKYRKKQFTSECGTKWIGKLNTLARLGS
ncbi:aminotransferase class IV [Croceivirga lutea]|uniref:aminotransferase class IV n=1 Tax=Croceivirga lutea TaxID=1775167 RepID=UPI00163A8006|nr:aminotransferase class IV [Croceivirga lutea]GGG43315.1 aminotransferase class IV [Croceivirga lutea]